MVAITFELSTNSAMVQRLNGSTEQNYLSVSSTAQRLDRNLTRLLITHSEIVSLQNQIPIPEMSALIQNISIGTHNSFRNSFPNQFHSTNSFPNQFQCQNFNLSMSARITHSEIVSPISFTPEIVSPISFNVETSTSQCQHA